MDLDSLIKEANNGDIFSQYQLGNEYYYGKNTKRDDVEALKWYKKAAKQGCLDAEYMVEKILGLKHKVKLNPTCEHYFDNVMSKEDLLMIYGRE